MQTDTMATRENLFTMRMSDEERQRLEQIATHYGANGATVVRMLLTKEEREMNSRARLGSAPHAADPLTPWVGSADQEQYADALRAIRDLESDEAPAFRDDVFEAAQRRWSPRDRSLPRRLNRLCGSGYAKRVNLNGAIGYRLTPRGLAWFEDDASDEGTDKDTKKTK